MPSVIHLCSAPQPGWFGVPWAPLSPRPRWAERRAARRAGYFSAGRRLAWGAPPAAATAARRRKARAAFEIAGGWKGGGPQPRAPLS
ncbi:unnamed protein product [Prorocentrum cordatum]|uniref:Uncharacterized protein n=1 Tax=Prorocentrum cordatum TaxID=2364126 RepID=A0ABN9WA56_9DINO|nr:unnamed protein product [Polarella glacialis]